MHEYYFKTPKWKFCINTHKRSISREDTFNFLALLLPLVAKWYLLRQLRSCWQINSQHPCCGIPSGLQTQQHGPDVWIFITEMGDGSFLRGLESVRAFPNHVKGSPTATLNCGYQPDWIQLFPGWYISAWHLTQFNIRSAGRGRKKGAEGKAKLSSICCYTAISWEQPGGSPEEKHLGVAVDEKLNMTHQHTLAVQEDNRIPKKVWPAGQERWFSSSCESPL